MAPAQFSALPAKSVLAIMRQAMGGEQDVITSESVDAITRCTAEFLSFVVSEARESSVHDGSSNISYAHILGTLQSLGFKCAGKAEFDSVVAEISHLVVSPTGALLNRSRPT